ncbi:hypothetical protein LMG19083_04861 [Ralstonia psammae]|uniref:DUF2827 domain-containing protein n=1 Tax=Ralstonia psammae TaxID=3058598 RepID=A0ABN9JEB7_9RALS|nr:DUF2827 domain-containing protein [Ralstonia sp. LMG 19083]CAJ0809153.1 hypothetical protein LMG19083_04861 [Ralstonia sp. LMG 19083]
MQQHTAAGQPAGLRIGITVGLRESGESLWVNGIKQNALYLAKLFMHSPRAHRVTLVNTTGPVSEVPWDAQQFPVDTFEACKDRLDVLIELGGQVSEAQTRYLKARGTKLVSYCCGAEYVQNIEAMIFGRPLHRDLFINQGYDDIWVIPQVMQTSAGFFSTLRRRAVREVPFVWDPMCLTQVAASLPEAGEYRPRAGAKRVAIMEPNFDVLKFCLYPMLIAEQAYRAAPASIAHVSVTSAEHLARHSPEFIGVAQYLDLVRDHKITFVGRYDTPPFLAQYADVVVSHQWDNPLNYFYFDVCWQGYALVHNARLCASLGYYYPEHNVEAGAARLREAIAHTDAGWEDYRRTQRARLAPFLATDPARIAHYDALLDALLGAHRQTEAQAWGRLFKGTEA